MSDIDLAVSNCKELESLLERRFGASGKGLHEKVSSVEDRLPRELVRKIRLVATVRNKIVHESDYQKIDDRKGFLSASTEARKELIALSGGGGSAGRWIVLFIIVLLLIAAYFAWRMFVAHR